MHSNPPQPSPDARRFLRLKEVQARVGLSRSTIYASISSGTFPKPFRIGARAVAWISDDITAWIEARCNPSCVAITEAIMTEAGHD
jgi:prophage regulatory protein